MRTTLMAIVLSSFAFFACRSIAPIIKTDGPDVAKFMVKTGVRWALAEKHSTAEQALKIQSYVLQGRTLIADGTAPVGALDELAAILNSKIENELVRRAIQQGVEFIKSSVSIPVDGVITPALKVWILAVLDGAIQGCQEYAVSLDAPGAAPSLSAPDYISFRK